MDWKTHRLIVNRRSDVEDGRVCVDGGRVVRVRNPVSQPPVTDVSRGCEMRKGETYV